MYATRRIIFCAATLTVTACLGTATLAQERREVPEFRTFGAPARATDADEIAAMLNAYEMAWRKEDSQALIQLHAVDVEWINAYARMFRGNEALGHFLEDRLFSQFAAAVSAEEATNMRPISIRYISENTAVAHLYTDGRRGPSRNEDESLRRTHFHLVLGRQGEDWKIVHCAIMDAR